MDKFWTQVEIKSYNECWLWKGAKTSRGYGSLHIRMPDGKRKTISAHRKAWEIANQSTIPEGKVIMHTCDNPACVNPSHLRLGTTTDNNRDTVKKRRGFVGHLNGRAKLTSQQVVEIRNLYQGGDYSMQDLGSQFGVTGTMVCNIVNHKSWKHIAEGAS